MPGGELGAGCLRSRWCSRARTARGRRRAAAWSGRRSGTGCIATTPRGWRGRGPAAIRAAAAVVARAARRAYRSGGGGAGGGGRRGGALALCRPAGVIADRFAVELSERSVGRLLNRRGYTRLQPRPASEGRSGGPGGVQKNFAAAVAAALPEQARVKPLEIWFQDEARIGQQGTLTRVWAKRGTRPRAIRDTRYKWAYLFGAVCPPAASAPPWCCRAPIPGR